MPYSLHSLSDRKPVQKEDEIVVMVVPDYQMLEYVERITSTLSDDPVPIKIYLFLLLFGIDFVYLRLLSCHLLAKAFNHVEPPPY